MFLRVHWTRVIVKTVIDYLQLPLPFERGLSDEVCKSLSLGGKSVFIAHHKQHYAQASSGPGQGINGSNVKVHPQLRWNTHKSCTDFTVFSVLRIELEFVKNKEELWGLTLLRLRSSTKQVNLLFPLGTNVLACFHSKQDDSSLHRLLDVVNLLQDTVKLNTSPISPPCCFKRWRKMEVFPQPASPTSKTGLPPSLSKPTRWEIRCWEKIHKERIVR